jgi:hypothetical protein
MSPAELAEEYGCTNGHVRNLLSDLREDGTVQRVAHGQYEAVEDEGDDADAELLSELPTDSEGNAETGTDDGPPEETAEETPEPTGGQAPSEDHDTEDSEPLASGESMGIPVPVSANLVVGVAAVFLLFMLWRRLRPSSSPSDQSSQPAPSTDEDDESIGEDVALFGGA